MNWGLIEIAKVFILPCSKGIGFLLIKFFKSFNLWFRLGFRFGLIEVTKSLIFWLRGTIRLGLISFSKTFLRLCLIRWFFLRLILSTKVTKALFWLNLFHHLISLIFHIKLSKAFPFLLFFSARAWLCPGLIFKCFNFIWKAFLTWLGQVSCDFYPRVLVCLLMVLGLHQFVIYGPSWTFLKLFRSFIEIYKTHWFRMSFGFRLFFWSLLRFLNWGLIEITKTFVLWLGESIWLGLIKVSKSFVLWFRLGIGLRNIRSFVLWYGECFMFRRLIEISKALIFRFRASIRFRLLTKTNLLYFSASFKLYNFLKPFMTLLGVLWQLFRFNLFN